MKVHSVESLAALDGEGIRYAIYLTGCPLRCVYCHNPDTWICAGKDYFAEELYNKIKRYKPYFGTKGGVTFSGGEPLLSANFINEINDYLHKDGINYVLDTSGCVDLTDDVKKAIDNSSCVILDIKFYNDETYLKYTGKDMKKTMAFYEYLCKTNKRCWLRTVIVPGINDKEEILDKYIEAIKIFDNVEKWELLAFHNMGFFKYDKLGIENPLKDVSLLDTDKLKKLQDYLNKSIKNSI